MPLHTWASTLKLPTSTFGARPLLSERERLIRACTDDLYRTASSRQRDSSSASPFIIHDGPPYANGSLHAGHALNKILKDMILRVELQKGNGARKVVYRPGWDCHGLPIEVKALERIGATDPRSLSAAEIRTRARQLAQDTIKEQMNSFKSYAVMADWEGKWTTMDHGFEIRQLRLFQGLVETGLIYRKHKPVYWSPSSRTALAEAELEYKDDHVSHSAYVKFPMTTPNSLSSHLEGLNLHALIWTTTPWTLPANQAVGIHRDMEYTVVKLGSDALLVLKARLASSEIQGILGGAVEVLVETIRGSDLEGLSYSNKLRGRDSPRLPIIHADFVAAESGTGLVHMAPGHGHEDYEVCSPMGIEALAPITDDGHFTSEAYPDDPAVLTQAGLIFEGGSRAVIKLLGDDVVAIKRYKHKYPYDWRTKQPVVVRATAQWFCDVAAIRDWALEALDPVRFIPESSRTRLVGFIKGRNEWCISRQRAWGVPIPALYDQEGNPVMTQESIEHIIKVMNERGSDAWFSDAPDDPSWILPSLKGQFTRSTDTMDVWFDSGSSWQETKGQADIYLEGTDQHRGWFQSSLLTWIPLSRQASTDLGSWRPQAPFRNLITHGFSLDEHGKKMSKSLGNVITPMQIMDGTMLAPPRKSAKKGSTREATSQQQPGPDAVRIWAASSDYTKDVTISPQVVGNVVATLQKYRSMLKMFLGSIARDAAPADTQLTKLDHLAICQLLDAHREVRAAFEGYEFYKAVGAINRWITTDVSAFYLEALKDRLYCGDGGGVLPLILQATLRFLAPVTPVLVEEAWEHTPAWLKERMSGGHPCLGTDLSFPFDGDSGLGKWRAEVEPRAREAMPVIMAAHEAVKLALERARRERLIGQSLQARVIIRVEPSSAADGSDDLGRSRIRRALRWFGDDELATALVVSACNVDQPVPEGHAWHFEEPFAVRDEVATVHVLPPLECKCPRCWRYLAPSEEELCGRCDEVIKAAS